jgi:chemosensory pili system protein ChpA (sensor histidine kinase/response regulator)
VVIHAHRHARHSTTVFYVDDDVSLLTGALTVLDQAGYLALGARDGVEALARMRGSFGARVAIVDLAMPRMSGWQLIEQMKRDPTLASVCIVLATAMHEDAAATQLQLEKPFDADELLAVVRRAARMARRALHGHA